MPLSVRHDSDLAQVEEGAGVRRLYSSHFMTPAHAALLVRRSGGLLHLFAETVRENSARWRRPFPLGAFEQPPFRLTRQEILARLQAMTADDAYQDVARACTSAENAYLYPIAHRNADHAAGLAE